MRTMDEKDILLKTIEGLNTYIASLSATNKNQEEQIKNLQERIKELTAQIAWLNRQLFGRKTEKRPVYNPDMPDLFAVTKVVKHKPGMLYVKEIIRSKYALKDSTQLPSAGQKGVEIAPCHRCPSTSASPTPAYLPRYCFRSMNTISRSTVRYSSTGILG